MKSNRIKRIAVDAEFKTMFKTEASRRGLSVLEFSRMCTTTSLFKQETQKNEKKRFFPRL